MKLNPGLLVHIDLHSSKIRNYLRKDLECRQMRPGYWQEQDKNKEAIFDLFIKSYILS